MSELLTSRQAAERLGTTTTTINRWAKSGRLAPALQVPGYNGAHLFKVEDVEAVRENADKAS